MITVFASRKISLYSMISDINFQLSILSQKRQNLVSVGMTIADGQVSPDEVQQSNYYTQNGIANVINFGNALNQQTAYSGQPALMVFRNQMNPNIISLHSRTVELAQAQLAAQEKSLELQVKSLETKLGMYEKDLDKVEQAEKSWIERSAPKYTSGNGMA